MVTMERSNITTATDNTFTLFFGDEQLQSETVAETELKTTLVHFSLPSLRNVVSQNSCNCNGLAMELFKYTFYATKYFIYDCHPSWYRF